MEWDRTVLKHLSRSTEHYQSDRECYREVRNIWNDAPNAGPKLCFENKCNYKIVASTDTMFGTSHMFQSFLSIVGHLIGTCQPLMLISSLSLVPVSGE